MTLPYVEMMIEIERKFLVRGDFPRIDGTRIVQGYLSRVPERTVRVRVVNDKGYITIKGMSDAEGVSRFEWEREITAEEAVALLKLAEPGVIEKTRWRVPVASLRGGTGAEGTNARAVGQGLEGAFHVFEVDEFHGAHEGLIIAEVELSRPDEPFDHPAWLGDEVTGDARYYNAAL